MEIFVVITVARMVEGEFLFVKTERAFKQASKADELVKKLQKDFTTPEGKVKPIKVSTASGEAVCACTVGAFQVEIEE